jgi:hypothetical protein
MSSMEISARNERIVALAAAGRSTAEILKEIGGISRNTVLGVLYRDRQAKGKVAEKSGPSNKITRDDPRFNRLVSLIRGGVSLHDMRLRLGIGGPQAKRLIDMAVEEGLLRRDEVPTRKPAAPKVAAVNTGSWRKGVSLPPLPIDGAALADPVSTEPRHVALYDLTMADCHCPTTYDAAAPFGQRQRYCGAPAAVMLVRAGLVARDYCRAHLKLIYTKGTGQPWVKRTAPAAARQVEVA